MALSPLVPPRPYNARGAPRRVGVEIEFSGLDCAATANLVTGLFGGRGEQVDQHHYVVTGTVLGGMTIALDMSTAHPENPGADSLADRLEKMTRAAIGDIGSLIMPNEISTAPLAIGQLPDVDRLAAALVAHGACGTRGSPLYAFGLHLNPEIAAEDAGYLLDHLRAFALCAPWLRRQIDIDISRRISPFIDPYPEAYVRRILDPDYGPDRRALIEDYIDANPTRNRELDMFPMFAHLEPAVLVARVRDKRVKGRPTFHYRLPNSDLDEPGWNVVTEWNRWVAVEGLAADRDRLMALGRLYLERGDGYGWPATVQSWIAA